MAQYIERRLTRILLLAALLAAGFVLRETASAKYASYLNDYTSVAAGDFCFSSNYLMEGNGAIYSINSWDGKTYEVEMKIRNYENSLRFNKEGMDFYYYIDATLYEDDGTVDNTFSITIDYDEQAGSGWFSGEGGTRIACKRMDGMNDFDAETGTQTVKVSLDNNAAVAGPVRRNLVIEAHTVPQGVPIYSTANGNDKVADYGGNGVFYETRRAEFQLFRASAKAAIEADLTIGTDYAVLYRLRCDGITGGSSAQVNVYYNDSELTPDTSLGTVLTDSTSQNPFTKFVTVTVYDGGATSLYFYRKSLNDEIAPSDFAFTTVNSVDMDDNDYTIEIDGSITGGNVSTPAGTAKMNQTVDVTVTASAGYGLYSASVTTAGGDQVSITPTGNGFSFCMPNSNVAILAVFKHTINIETAENGSISTSASLANAGETITVTASAPEGYVSQKPIVEWNGGSIEVTESDEQYTFIMPDGPVTVRGNFVSDTDQNEG